VRVKIRRVDLEMCKRNYVILCCVWCGAGNILQIVTRGKVIGHVTSWVMCVVVIEYSISEGRRGRETVLVRNKMFSSIQFYEGGAEKLLVMVPSTATQLFLSFLQSFR
jgi:hypothetical protein